MINGGLGLLMAANARRRYVISYAVIASGMWLIYITVGLLGEIRLIFKRKPRKQRDRDRDSHVAPPAPHYGAYDMETDETTDVERTSTEFETTTSTGTRDSVDDDKELRTYGYA
jgi:hypothetical protein